MPTETLRPNGAGALTGLTANAGVNWQMVDEDPHDGDTTFNYRASAWPASDLYALANHASGSGKINSVTVYSVGRYSITSGTIRLGLYTNSTEYWEASSHALTIGYATYSAAWATNPNTGLAWTWADIDALQAGAQLTSGGTALITQLYVVVDFTPMSRLTLLGAG